MTSDKPRKKTYLGWKVHGHIIARFVLYWALYNFILWQALCARQFLQYESAFSGGKPALPPGATLQSIVRENSWIVAFALIAFPMLLWETVRLTHRIVGPLQRLEGVLNRMTKGETVREVNFRTGDLIESFELAFNRYLASLPAAKTDTPMSDDELTSVMHDLRNIAGETALTPRGDSDKINARSERDTPLPLSL